MLRIYRIVSRMCGELARHREEVSHRLRVAEGSVWIPRSECAAPTTALATIAIVPIQLRALRSALSDWPKSSHASRGRSACSLLVHKGSLVFVGVPVKRRGVRNIRSGDTNATPSRRPALQGSEV
jgi:hypothetical protein